MPIFFIEAVKNDTFCKKADQQKLGILWQRWGEFDRNRPEIILFFKKAWPALIEELSVRTHWGFRRDPMFLIFLSRLSLGNAETVRLGCAATIMCTEHTSSGDSNP